MKKLPNIREIYRGVRKPVPPPSRVRQDEREKIRRRADEKEMRERADTRDERED